MNHRVLFLITLLSCTSGLFAQEMNFGLHLNPVFTNSITDKTSVHDKEIKMTPLRIGYNAGINLNLKFRKTSLETGINIISKTAQFRQRVQVLPNGSESRFSVQAKSLSFEVPVLLGYHLKHHAKSSVYDMYGQFGLSYELNRAGGVKQSFGAVGPSSMTVYEPTKLFPAPGSLQHNVNIIAGIKLNTVVRGLGLVDYGISYHFPLLKSGSYYISSYAATISPNQQYIYSGTFRPRLGYIDLKLCYYLLNLDSKHKKISYKVPAKKRAGAAKIPETTTE